MREYKGDERYQFRVVFDRSKDDAPPFILLPDEPFLDQYDVHFIGSEKDCKLFMKNSYSYHWPYLANI